MDATEDGKRDHKKRGKDLNLNLNPLSQRMKTHLTAMAVVLGEGFMLRC